METYNILDLFAGCGGLTEGFKQAENTSLIGAVEWETAPIKNLINRLETKWHYESAKSRVLQFDIQRTKELFSGWEDDPEFGSHEGLDKIVDGRNVDLIIGGPPCQAYSVAGRIRDENGMRNDYRNYLFEGYMEVVKKYKPKAFIFENVKGILSAKPNSISVTELIKDQINNAGYEIIDDLKEHALIDLAEYGIPQKRNRVIILGVNKAIYKNPKKVLLEFYKNILPFYKEDMKSVKDTISELPALYPAKEDYKLSGRKYSHHFGATKVPNHLPRYHSKRDIEIFKELAEDIDQGTYKYASPDALKQLYTARTGKISNVHKYYVLRRDKPSNTIPAHLYKDGLRHIHPDPKQARSLTVREAARLQTFEDDYEFITSSGKNYKMIGNAVPPKFAKKIALAVSQILTPSYYRR